MLAFTTLFTLAGFASTSFAAAIPDNRNGCPSNRWLELQTGQCVNAGYGCPSYPQTFRNVAIQGTYPDPATMTCIQCPYGAWECPNGVPKQCYIDSTVLVDGKCVPEAECLATGNKFVAKSYNTNPLRYHRFCNDCDDGKSAWKSNYQCDTCPSSLGKAKQCTADKALSCMSGYVLYEDKCLDTKCPDGWYNDNGVCKTCASQDPKSVTCELGKSLTCTRNQLLILSTNRCGTSACPYTPANGLPGSYRDGLVCRSCAPEAFNCDAGGALNCYNPDGVQYYRLERACVTKDQCLAAKPTSKLFTQLQSSTGVTYGTC